MNSILSEKRRIEYFDSTNPDAHISLGKCILKYLNESLIESHTPVILCIGTDRATGDCLGPLVGEQLYEYHEAFHVYGNLSYPVHALNLKDVIDTIQTNHENPYIIAVDASLGSSAHIGYATVSDYPMAPGKGVNKKLPVIGDLSITGIVNVSGQHPNLLQNTRLFTVMQLANCIAESIKYAIDYLEVF